MTYQGERARALDSEAGRYFAVSKVRIDADGHVSAVLWQGLDARADRPVGEPARASAAEVVDALHDGAQVSARFGPGPGALPERPFVVIEHGSGRECISFAPGASAGRELANIAQLDEESAP